MQYIIKSNKKITKNNFFLFAVFCVFTLVFPLQSYAEEKNIGQNDLQLPEARGKLDLTLQKSEDIAMVKGEQKEILNNKETSEENQLKEGIAKEALSEDLEEKRKNIQTKREDIILAPGHNQHSVIMKEDGSNVMIVHGSNKKPENYTNSTNVNNGFYMNITNPDGSGMNMGTYFNSNSSSNSPHRQSRAQIIVDKRD